MLLALFIFGSTLFGGGKPTPTPAPKSVQVAPTLPPRPDPMGYEDCEKALDQIGKYCADSYPTYCEKRVPKLPKE